MGNIPLHQKGDKHVQQFHIKFVKQAIDIWALVCPDLLQSLKGEKS